MRILLIEDEKDIALSVQDMLKEHYVVDISYKGKTGLYKAHIHDYDLIILDVVLPDIDGFTVCKQLREDKNFTPVLFLTGKHNIRDRIIGLDVGGDDYLVKPFSYRELIARVRAILRRNVGHYVQDILSIDDLIMNTHHRTVVRDEKPIRLRKKAFDLLEYLIRNQDRVLTRDMILEHVWENSDEFSNTVDVHIKHLRDKIDKPYNHKLIKTVHGLGYKISHDDS